MDPLLRANLGRKVLLFVISLLAGKLVRLWLVLIDLSGGLSITLLLVRYWICTTSVDPSRFRD